MGIIKKYTIGNKVDKLKKIEQKLKNIIEFQYGYTYHYELNYGVKLIITTKEKNFKDCLNIIDYLNKNKIKYSLYNWGDELEYTIKIDD